MGNNAFMASAEKSKRKQADIERPKRGRSDTMWTDFKVINVRVPKELHRKMQLHNVETGENMTQLINRLLTKELG